VKRSSGGDAGRCYPVNVAPPRLVEQPVCAESGRIHEAIWAEASAQLHRATKIVRRSSSTASDFIDFLAQRKEHQ
jgi:hypothetical protein